MVWRAAYAFVYIVAYGTFQLIEAAFRLGTKLVVVAIGALLITVTCLAVSERGARIDPISVPKVLDEAGYTSTAVSRQLREEIQFIDRASNRTRVLEAPDAVDRQAHFNFTDEHSPLADIKVPSSDLSLQSLVDLLRDLLPLERKKISGEMVISRPDGPFSRTAFALVLHYGHPPPSDFPPTPIFFGSINEAIHAAALAVVEEFDPAGLALYYLRENELRESKWEEMERVTKRMIAPPTPTGREGQGLYLQGLRWLDDDTRGPKDDEVLEVKRHKLKEAIRYFKLAIDRDEKLAAAHDAWGTALMRQENSRADAIAHYSMAIELLKGNSSFLDDRGIAYRCNGDTARALADFDQALGLNKADAWAYLNRGFTHRDLGQWKQAIEDFGSAISYRPNFGLAFRSRGIVRIELATSDDSAIKDPERAALLNDAIDDFNRAILIGKDRGDPEALYHRGLARKRLGSNEDKSAGEADIKEARSIRRTIEQEVELKGPPPRGCTLLCREPDKVRDSKIERSPSLGCDLR